MTEGCVCWCWFCMYLVWHHLAEWQKVVFVGADFVYMYLVWHHLAEWQKVVFVGADFVCILSGIILMNDRRLYLLVLILYVSCLASSWWMFWLLVLICFCGHPLGRCFGCSLYLYGIIFMLVGFVFSSVTFVGMLLLLSWAVFVFVVVVFL